MLHNYKLNFMYGYKSYTDTGSKITLGTKFYVESELNAGSQTMYVGAEGSGVTDQIASATDASEFNTGLALYLFACNYGGLPNYCSKARCYELKIWQDGRLVRYYRPVRLQNGYVVLWDKVENQACVLKSTRASEAAGYFSAVGPDGSKIGVGTRLIIR